VTLELTLTLYEPRLTYATCSASTLHLLHSSVTSGRTAVRFCLKECHGMKYFVGDSRSPLQPARLASDAIDKQPCEL
jgi:hypothetical protein